jgi:hypothetical protein
MKTLLLVLCLFSTGAFADYKTTIYGKTQTEREIRWLWKYVNEFVVSCAGSKAECQNAEVRSLAQNLVGYLPAFDSIGAKDWANLLEFVSEKDRPDLFKTDAGDVHRVAVTELAKYSKVYINTDRMNLPIERWAGILAHEVAHHLGVLDDEKRLPDALGAEIEKHFKRRMQFSALDQFNLPELRTLTFNADIENHLSIGFVSFPTQLSDVNWGSTPQQPVCQVYESVRRQYASAPVWRVNRFRPKSGVVSIRGGGSVRMDCFNRTTGQTRTNIMPLGASVDLQYSAPLDFDHWMDETPTFILDQAEWGPSVNAGDHKFGLAQTFLILSTVHNSLTLKAGDVWHVTLTTKSVDGFIPDSCQLFVSGTQYAFLKQDNIPGVNFFPSCVLKNLGGGQWQVDGDLKFPTNTRPDRYYVPAIIFSSAHYGDRVAVPVFPSMITVENSGAPAPPVIHEMKVLDLPRAAHLGTLKLTDSYLVSTNQTYTVQFQVEGPQTISEAWLDFDIWFPRTDEFGIALGTGSSLSVKQIGLLLEEKYERNEKGTLITMKFKALESIGGVTLSALKFRRVYFRASDFSWVELELPMQHDSMIVNSNFGG